MWTVAHGLTYLAATAQLAAAEVSIAVRPDGASAAVETTYRIRFAGDSVRFRLIPGERQQILLDRRGWPPGRLDRGSDLVTYAVPWGQVGGEQVLLRHSVTVDGHLSRVPLFVPDVPTDPGAVGSVTLRMRGLPPAAALGGGFPRMTRGDDGSARATLANLPGFVLLPGTGGWMSANRVGDVSVVVLLVLATAGWVVRRRRR